MVIALIYSNDMLLITTINIIMMGIILKVMITIMITVVTMTLIGTLRDTLPRLRYDNSNLFNLYVSWRMFPGTCLLSTTLTFK